VSAARDPFAVLGLGPEATLEEVRAARRRLAKEAHPDHGGDVARMREINAAFDAAVKAILRPPPAPTPAAAPAPPRPASPPPHPAGRSRPAWPHSSRSRRLRLVEQDAASFVVEAFRPDAFEALMLASHWLGEPLDDEPPFWLEAHIYEPGECWCRLELLPEAGATMVAVTVGHIEGTPWPPPGVDDVRDAWIAALTSLGPPE